MPTYEYRCARCGQHLEVYQSFSEAPLTKHEGCGGKLTKVLSPAGIVLKGSGFYKTDNRSSKSRPKDTPAEPKTDKSAAQAEPAGGSGSAASKTSGSSSGSGGEAKTA